MPRAPRRCPGGNGTCTERIHPPAKYCTEHTRGWMWRTKTASSQATQDHHFRRIRLEVLDRDHHRCRIQIPGRCTTKATCVDHIVPVERGGARLDPTNLQAACRPCNEHKARTTDRA